MENNWTELSSGKIIGERYEVIKKIGQGGMSAVYLVIDRHLKKNWAMKEVRAESVKDFPLTRQSLMLETEILKNLNHPNLPKVVDVLENDDVIYIVMDYIEGKTLKEVLIEDGPQPQENVIEWGKQLCDILNYLHTRTPPIIYRDMKPGNIILKPEGGIILFDFGIAREFKYQNIEDTSYLGTMGYAAPEQFGGHGQTDERTDIFGLGVTMYHLVTGMSPGGSPNDMVPIRKINPSLSSSFEDIIIKCTKSNPAERYQNCRELLYALHACPARLKLQEVERVTCKYSPDRSDSKDLIINRILKCIIVLVALCCYWIGGIIRYIPLAILSIMLLIQIALLLGNWIKDLSCNFIRKGGGNDNNHLRHDVFISYKHSERSSDFDTFDCRMAEALHKAFTNRGLDVFLDTVSLPRLGASDYRREIKKALSRSDILVVVTTSIENLYTDWISWEIDTFYENSSSDDIYCFITNDIDVKRLPGKLSGRTCFRNESEAVEYIMNRLRKECVPPDAEETQRNKIKRIWEKIENQRFLSNGRYEIYDKIKEGEYYSLYTGFDRHRNERCVIKIINRYKVPEDYVDLEIDLLRKHRDGGIPLLYDSFDNSPEISYSVMTYVPGRSLEEIKKSGQTIVEKDVIAWSIRLLEILEKLHNCDECIIHCNVKPNNIFLGDNQHISLINYSCACRLNGMVNYKYQAKNKRYAAPEIVLSGKPVDCRTDIFSVGYVMLYMLTDKNKVINRGIIYPEQYGISPELVSVICKCMKYEPNERYNDCKSLLNDLHLIQYGLFVVPKDTSQSIDISYYDINEGDDVTGMTCVL